MKNIFLKSSQNTNKKDEKKNGIKTIIYLYMMELKCN